jgi:hypothetical protein
MLRRAYILYGGAMALLPGCATSSGLLVTRTIRVEIAGVDARQRAVLEETLRALEALEPAPLAIDEAQYRRDAAFEKLFGFPFSGSALAAWWSARIERIELGDAWTVAVYGGGHDLVVRHDFFDRPLVERLETIVHEARHADGGGFQHVDCPKGFGLEGRPACDLDERGAYAFEAAFMYELFARNLIDPAAAHRAWRSARQRVRSRIH